MLHQHLFTIKIGSFGAFLIDKLSFGGDSAKLARENGMVSKVTNKRLSHIHKLWGTHDRMKVLKVVRSGIEHKQWQMESK